MNTLRLIALLSMVTVGALNAGSVMNCPYIAGHTGFKGGSGEIMLCSYVLDTVDTKSCYYNDKGELFSNKEMYQNSAADCPKEAPISTW